MNYPEKQQYASGPPIAAAPGAVVAPVAPQAVAMLNDFQTGLCDCCEGDNGGRVCLDGWCCSWCDAGYQAKALQTGNGGQMDTFVGCGLFFIDCCIAGGLAIACYNGCALRPDIKKKYGITTESDTMTFLKGFCCHECSSCQTHREMILRRNGPGGICTGTVDYSASNPYATGVVVGQAVSPTYPVAAPAYQQPMAYPEQQYSTQKTDGH